VNVEIRGTTRLIALFGDPVSHSLSPAMHNPAFAIHEQDFAYVPLRVRPVDLERAVKALRIFNFRGANITLPHKQAIIPFLDEISDISKLMGVVNTVVNDNGRLFGTTTDPQGFIAGFQTAGYNFAGQTIAILGNGGSARTIAFALLTQAKPAQIFLVGRDKQKVKSLEGEITQALSKMRPNIDGKILDTSSLADYAAIKKSVNIVVNATPVGMHPDTEFSPIPASELQPSQIIYDIVYVPETTRLMRDAQAMGLKTVGGLGMLVHQGLASYELWTGLKPEASQYFASARAQLAHRNKTKT
jgi:shikimate dehydrogenase